MADDNQVDGDEAAGQMPKPNPFNLKDKYHGCYQY